MNRIRAVARLGAMLGALVATASCAPKAAPEPERPPVRTTELPPPNPTPVPPPQPVAGWEDMPLSPGDWTYRAEDLSAAFGGGVLTLRCDLASRRVTLARAGAAAGTLAVRTSYGARSLPAGPGGAVLPASDPLLDQMVFSRGRFAVEAEGQARLILPTWPEPARVVEECRE